MPLLSYARCLCESKHGVHCHAAVDTTYVSMLEGWTFQHRLLWYCRDVAFMCFVYFVLFVVVVLYTYMCLVFYFSEYKSVCLTMFLLLTLLLLSLSFLHPEIASKGISSYNLHIVFCPTDADKSSKKKKKLWHPGHVFCSATTFCGFIPGLIFIVDINHWALL